MQTAQRARPALFRALGADEPPAEITIAGETCRLEELYKHDSWAATGLYRGAEGSFAVKFNRRQPIFFLPTAWLGRWLARRERCASQKLAGLAGVPEDAGEVRVAGRALRNACAHRFVNGRPLGMEDHPSAAFFEELARLLAAIHARGMAHADLNKRENLICTPDGRPMLLDWQLHFAPPAWAARLPGIRHLLRELQVADRYHLQKHLRWHRPDLFALGDGASSIVPPISVRLWRAIYVGPVQGCRRRLLVWLGIRCGKGLAVSERCPEMAARLALKRKAEDPATRLPGED